MRRTLAVAVSLCAAGVVLAGLYLLDGADPAASAAPDAPPGLSSAAIRQSAVEGVALVDPPPKTPLSRQAWVFLTTNDLHLRGLLAMNEGLRMVGSTRPRAVLVSPHASQHLRATAELVGLTVLELPEPPEVPGYDRVVYVDVDAVVNSNPDWLFDEPEDFAAMQDDFGCVRREPVVASGLLSIRPSAATHAGLLRLLAQRNWTGGDQEVIGTYFTQVDTRRPLKTYDERVSGFVWRCFCIDEGSIPRYDYSRMAIVQFTGAHMDYRSLATQGLEGRWYRGSDCANVHYQRWLDTWEAALAHLRRELREHPPSAAMAEYLNQSVFV
eukprot:m51a1_g6531 hypothetical protein (326) ;mRNA; r:18165-19300